MSTTPMPKVRINRVNMVGTLGYKTHDDTCAICKNSLSSLPPNTMNSQLTAKSVSESFPVQGRCDHVFHQHCITAFTNSTSETRKDVPPVCPECNTNWRIKIPNLDEDRLGKTKK
jgi:hypothetical protein